MDDITNDFKELKTRITTSIKYYTNESYKLFKQNSILIGAYFFGIILLYITLLLLSQFFWFVPVVGYFIIKNEYVVVSIKFNFLHSIEVDESEGKTKKKK